MPPKLRKGPLLHTRDEAWEYPGTDIKSFAGLLPATSLFLYPGDHGARSDFEASPAAARRVLGTGDGLADDRFRLVSRVRVRPHPTGNCRCRRSHSSAAGRRGSLRSLASASGPDHGGRRRGGPANGGWRDGNHQLTNPAWRPTGALTANRAHLGVDSARTAPKNGAWICSRCQRFGPR